MTLKQVFEKISEFAKTLTPEENIAAALSVCDGKAKTIQEKANAVRALCIFVSEAQEQRRIKC